MPSILPSPHPSARDFGFKPRVALRDGIHRTVLWWLEYQRARTLDKQRVAELRHQAKLGERLDDDELLSPSMQFLAELRHDHDKARTVRLNRGMSEFGKTLDADRGRLVTPLDSDPLFDAGGFIFWEGLLSPSHELRLEAGASPAALRASCSADPSCVGYTTSGALKRRVSARERWERCETAGCGTFTAKGIDYCGRGLSDCGDGAECSNSAQPYTCVCKTGYSDVGAVCLNAADLSLYYSELRGDELETCTQENITVHTTTATVPDNL